jgi:uncharacterized protein YecT (DUF1311 family)
VTARDRRSEILEAKERNPLRHRFGSYAIEGLKSQWARIGNTEGTTPDFYVIRAVTLLEVFTKGNIGEIIDHESKYANRAIELSKNLKMDFALVQGIQGRAITLGDIVAHSVSVNSFGEMLGYFETLLDKPLRAVLTKTVDRWATEVEKKPSVPIIDDFELLARSLTRLFKVRHILCHETPKKAVYEVNEVEGFLDEAIKFTKALEEIINFELFGLTPLTQSEMNVAASRDLKSKEDELNLLLTEIQAKIKVWDDARSGLVERGCETSWLQSLDDAQRKWISFRNSQCDFDTYSYYGGSIRPTLWAGEASRLTDSRIADLRSWLKRESES